MRFRSGSRTSCGCCDPCSDLSARIDAAQADAIAAMAQADTAIGIANAQVAAAAASAASAASDAASALAQATNAASSAASALAQATAAAGSASSTAADAASMLSALAAKVDKLSTAGSFVYSHNNATQGEKAIVDGTMGDTIPIRDASGYIQAADPPSGDTTKKVATTNWISQTGDSSPNNVLHRSGNETKTGALSLLTGNAGLYINRSGNGNIIQSKALSYDADVHASTQYLPSLIGLYDQNDKLYAQIRVTQSTNGVTNCYLRLRNSDGTNKDIWLGSGDVI